MSSLPPTFTDKPFPSHTTTDEAIALVYEESPNIFLVISRNKNKNLMVYEAVLDATKRKLLGIVQYWLDIEPSYVAKARAQGRFHDRDEICKLDLFGYGLQVLDRSRPDRWDLKFKQCPKYQMTMRIGKDDVGLFRRDITTKAVLKVHHLHIHDRAIMGMLPTVDRVDIVAYDKTRKKVVENFIP